MERPAESTELEETLAARLAWVGVETKSATMRATLRGEGQGIDVEALRRVRAIAAGQEPSLSVLSTLGEGGMGIVQLGTQRSLAREVAIKTLRAKAQSPDALARLVREAVVTGALEHPNIVPVYDLAVGEADVPVLVMKRVEGATWSARMRDAAAVKALSGANDLLEWNVTTLMSVCRAAHFAHSRGVVHRDLKPENVMIGGFGEVYVVDWGIATRASADAPPSTPSGTVLGTPAYMAPEMLLCTGVSPRTDVYLLGAILFEVVTGKAPHDVEGGLPDVVRSVLAPKIELPAQVPEELATLISACMQREPSARPESAEEVRRALAEFLRHRGSAELASRAEVRRGDLLEALRDPSASADRVQRLYGEVSFGFRAALEAWPDNHAARVGLTHAARDLVRYELDHGMAHAARSRLADLPEPDEALAAEVVRASAQVDEEARGAAALRADLDPRTGRRTRVRITLALGTLWIMQPVAVELGWLDPDSQAVGILAALGSITIWTAGMIVFRHTVFVSRLNRQLAGSVFFVFVAQILAHLCAIAFGLSAASTETLLLFMWFAVSGVFAMAVESRLVWAAIGFFVSFLVAARAPRYRHLAAAFSEVVLVTTAAYAWRARAATRAVEGALRTRPRDETARDVRPDRASSSRR